MAQIIKQIANLIQENRFEEAEAIMQRMAVEKANEPATLCELSKLAYSMNKVEEAKKYLQATLALESENFEAHYQLGIILLQEGKYDLAMPEFRHACENKTKFALGHFYWGLSLYKMGNFRGALGQFQEAHKIEPSLAVAAYYAGLVNQAQNKHNEAEKDFKAVLSIQPQFAPAHNALGVTLFHLQKKEEALAELEQACNLKKDFPLARLNLAIVLSQLGHFTKAIPFYEEALKSSQLTAAERGLGYNNLAVALMQSGQWEFAFEALLQSTSIAPHMVEAQVNLGLMQILLQEYDLAINNFARLNNSSAKIEAACYSGIALLCLARYGEAQSKLLQAYQWLKQDQSSLNNDLFHFQLLLWLSYAYIAGENYSEAQSHLEQITADIQRPPSNIQVLALDALGLCSALTEQHQKALEYFNQTLELDPHFALALIHRARSYEALHQPQLASNDYLQAIELDPACLDSDKDYIAQLLMSSRIEEALIQATKLLAFEPQNTGTKLLLAAALFRKGAYDQAKEIISSVIKESPNHVAAHTMLGQIYMAQGNYAHADEVFLNASKLENADADLFFFWANALNNIGFHELAIEKFKQAADINPYNADIYEAWAQTLKSLGRVSEAGNVYKLASSYLDDITKI